MDQPAMTPQTIIELLDRAEAEFRAETSDVELMANTSELQRDEMGEMDSAGQHPADVASETVEREIALGIRLEATDVLKEIAAARQRLERGAYGRCEVCGVDIHPERLEMVPWARRCAADEAHREAGWHAAPADEQPAVWQDDSPEPIGSREGSSWDPEDDHPVDSTEEAALHELGGGA
ncbi:MAG: TraR/DksA C4-type zinc finger protein [Actinobacteria bacterium]|nr:TraR/DksA C4-type zinc finger protein [Actinomycetota bacterium]